MLVVGAFVLVVFGVLVVVWVVVAGVLVVVCGVLVVVRGVLVVVFGVLGGGEVAECVVGSERLVAAVEWPVVELELSEPPPSASAAPPPSSNAAMSAISAHRPVRLLRGGGGGGVGRRGSRGLGGVGVCRTVDVAGGGGGAASIGTVAAVGNAAAIARVVSASPPPGFAIAWRSRSRTSAAVCGRSLGAFASICMTRSLSEGGMFGFRSIAGLGATRTCWCMTAAATSAMNGGSPVSISYRTHPSE